MEVSLIDKEPGENSENVAKVVGMDIFSDKENIDMKVITTAETDAEEQLKQKYLEH